MDMDNEIDWFSVALCVDRHGRRLWATEDPECTHSILVENTICIDKCQVIENASQPFSEQAVDLRCPRVHLLLRGRFC